MTPAQADRAALASIWWARRPGPTAHQAISLLAGPTSGLSDEDRRDVCGRLHAADQLSDAELESRLAALGGKALVGVQRKDLGYRTTSLEGLGHKVVGTVDDDYSGYYAPDGTLWKNRRTYEAIYGPAPGKPAGDYWSASVAPAPDPNLLASAIAAGKAALAAGFGPQKDVCRLCATTAPDETYGGRCRHWVAPAEAQRREAYRRDPQRLVEQAVQNERAGVSGYTTVVSLESKIALGAALANRGLCQ